jgi:Na+/H+ antiporter NhaA
MTIFFLLIGLGLEREIYQGEQSDIKNALLPIIAAIGGVVVTATIYLVYLQTSGGKIYLAQHCLPVSGLP